MPTKISKVDGKYRVSTPNLVHAFGTSKAKAERQARLLRAIDHGWKRNEESIHEEAQHVVDTLLNEVDQIGAVPIPASGKAYARLRGGIPALRRKQQLYINMARDLGNRGKSTKGFPNHDGSDYTGEGLNEAFTPNEAQVAWARRMLQSLNDGAAWIVPATGQIYQVSHADKTIILVEGDPNDPQGWHEMNKVLFATVGYRVLDGPENPDEMAFAEAMSVSIKKPLERHHTEKTTMSGGKYGKHVASKGKTAGKFKFPANFKVGHSIKA